MEDISQDNSVSSTSEQPLTSSGILENKPRLASIEISSATVSEGSNGTSTSQSDINSSIADEHLAESISIGFTESTDIPNTNLNLEPSILESQFQDNNRPQNIASSGLESLDMLTITRSSDGNVPTSNNSTEVQPIQSQESSEIAHASLGVSIPNGITDITMGETVLNAHIPTVVTNLQQPTPVPLEQPSPENDLDDIDRALNNEAVNYSSDDEGDSVTNSEMSPARVITGDSVDQSPESDVTAESESDGSASSSSSDNSDSSDLSDSSDSDSDSDAAEVNGENQQGDVNAGNGTSTSTSARGPERRFRRNRRDVLEDDLGDLSDDDGESGPLKTKNEVLDEPAPQLPADFTINPKTQIECAGTLGNISEKTVLITASTSGEYRILNENSIFCFADRTPIGILYETFGRIQSPIYIVKFDSPDKARELKSRVGEKVYYVVSSSSFVLTEAIKKVKGCDASDMHDEEIPIEEQDFSDDAKESEKKTKKKNKKKNKKKQESSGQENSAEHDTSVQLNGQGNVNGQKRKLNNRNSQQNNNRFKNQKLDNQNGQNYQQIQYQQQIPQLAQGYPNQFPGMGFPMQYQQQQQQQQMPWQGGMATQMPTAMPGFQIQNLTPDQIAYLQQVASALQPQSQPVAHYPQNQPQPVNAFGQLNNTNNAVNTSNITNLLMQLQSHHHQPFQNDQAPGGGDGSDGDYE